MTSNPFGFHARRSPARGGAVRSATSSDGVAFRLVRIAWMTAKLCRREALTLADYRRRFGVSRRSFFRDLAIVRQAGVYVDSQSAGAYGLLCFFSDSDASG